MVVQGSYPVPFGYDCWLLGWFESIGITPEPLFLTSLM